MAWIWYVCVIVSYIQTCLLPRNFHLMLQFIAHRRDILPNCFNSNNNLSLLNGERNLQCFIWDALLGIHIIVWNNVSYKTRMAIRRKTIVNIVYRNDKQKCIVKRWLNHCFERELSRTRPISPSVKVNSIQGSYNLVGLSETTGPERMEATCHSFRSREKSAQCPGLTLTVQVQPLDWTKCK